MHVAEVNVGGYHLLDHSVPYNEQIIQISETAIQFIAYNGF